MVLDVDLQKSKLNRCFMDLSIEPIFQVDEHPWQRVILMWKQGVHGFDPPCVEHTCRNLS